MKNLKVYFGAIAFVFGIGSVLASQFLIPKPGYERIFNTQGVIVACNFRCLCEAGPFICKFKVNPITVVNLYDLNNPVLNCGQLLTNNVNGGICNP